MPSRHRVTFSAVKCERVDISAYRCTEGEIYQRGEKLPHKISDESAWYGPEIAESKDKWIHIFTEDDRTEIQNVLDAVKRKYLLEEKKNELHNDDEQSARQSRFICTLKKSDFPFKRVGEKLREVKRALVEGQGFYLLRGLPIERWSRFEICIIYFGIGTYIGDAVTQNKMGHILGHVKDVGDNLKNPKTRIYRTTGRLKFHCDSCDVVGLLCLQQSKAGGESYICSATTLYNEMRKHHPHLLKDLCAPFWFDRKGEIPIGQLPYYSCPIYNYHKGLLSCIFTPSFIEAAQERFAPEKVPLLSSSQKEAKNMFEKMAEDPKFHLEMQFVPGDIQLLHNLTILHSRNAFEDFDDPDQKRHLLRLWLSVGDGRPLPPTYKTGRWVKITGLRGGIQSPDIISSAPLEAE